MDNTWLIIGFVSPVIGLLGLAAMVAAVHYAWAAIRYCQHRNDDHIDDRFEDRKCLQEVDDKIQATPRFKSRP